MPVSVNPRSEGIQSHTVELPEKWSNELVNQPETGMGFQDVEITTKDGRKVNGFVLNCSYLETITVVQVDDIEKIRVRDSQEVKRYVWLKP